MSETKNALSATNNASAKTTTHKAGVAACVALACLPICYIAWTIATTGGNVIFNDYIGWVAPVTEMLNGQMSWSKLLEKSFCGAHCMLLPMLAFFLNAKFFSWNANLDLWLGFVVAIARTILLFDVITDRTDGIRRWIFLPILTALSFGASQASVLLYGNASLSTNFSTFGFVLALWSFCKIESPARSSLLAIIGGMISCLSWGNTLPCWATLLSFLICRKDRNISKYAVIAFGMIMTFCIYLPHVRSNVEASTNASSINLLRVKFVSNLIGRTFANDTIKPEILKQATHSFIVFGICLLLVACAYLLARRAKGSADPVGTNPVGTVLDGRALVPAMLLLYGVTSCWFVSIARELLAPWYIPLGTVAWIGLVGLAYNLLVFTQFDKVNIRQTPNNFTGAASLITIASFAVLFLSTNLTYDDKEIFKYSRSPAGEACLRNWHDVPTYCEELLFTWGDGSFSRNFLDLANPLEANQLSAFAPQKVLSMQGDFATGKVLLDDYFASTGSEFIEGTDVNRPITYKSPTHANLFLAAGRSAEWEVTIPATVQKAHFKTACRQVSGGGKDQTGVNATIEIHDRRNDSVKRLNIVDTSKNWKDLDIDLKSCAGSTLQIKLNATSAAASSATANQQSPGQIFSYPIITIIEPEQRTTRGTKLVSTKLHPRNVDQPIDSGPGSISFPKLDTAFWKFNSGQQPRPSSDGFCTISVSEQPGFITNSEPLDVDTRKFQSFKIALSAPTSLQNRAVYILFNFSGKLTRASFLSLVDDDKKHTYSIPTQLFEIPPGVKLESIAIIPKFHCDPSTPQSFGIGEIGFSQTNTKAPAF